MDSLAPILDQLTRARDECAAQLARLDAAIDALRLPAASDGAGSAPVRLPPTQAKSAGGRTSRMLECDRYPGKTFTAKEAGELAGVTLMTIYSALRRGAPAGNDQLIFRWASSAAANPAPESPVTSVSAAAAALGRVGGLLGGPARAAKLSAGERSESAKKASAARWGNQPVSLVVEPKPEPPAKRLPIDGEVANSIIDSIAEDATVNHRINWTVIEDLIMAAAKTGQFMADELLEEASARLATPITRREINHVAHRLVRERVLRIVRGGGQKGPTVWTMAPKMTTSPRTPERLEEIAARVEAGLPATEASDDDDVDLD